MDYRQFVLSKLPLKGQALLNGVLGLCGEAGEVADAVKKHLFQEHMLDRDKLVDELGDVCFYLELTACCAGITLDEARQKNIEKLNRRFPNGFEAERSINREEV